MTLADIAAISSIVQVVVVLAALIFAATQAIEAQRSRRLSSLITFFDLIGREDIREIRNELLSLDIKSCQQMIAERGGAERTRSIARWKSLIAVYDRLGFLVWKRLLPSDDIRRLHGNDVESLWDRLGHVVTDVRAQRKGYALHFEWLAKQLMRGA